IRVVMAAGAHRLGIVAVALLVDMHPVQPGRGVLHLDVDAEAFVDVDELRRAGESAAAARLDLRGSGRRGRRRDRVGRCDGGAQVAHAGGWPISTDAGYLFAIADNGNGPFQISSPSGAFQPVTLRTESGVAWAIVPVVAPQGASYQFATRSGATFYDPLSRVFRYDGADAMSLP